MKEEIQVAGWEEFGRCSGVGVFDLATSSMILLRD